MAASHIPNVPEPRDGITYLNTESRESLAKGYEALAAWVRTSEFPIPRTVLYSDAVTLKIASSWIEDPGFVKRIGTAARLIGGKVQKGVEQYGTNFELTLPLGGGVKVLYSVDRGTVCEQVTEVKEVTEFVRSDAQLDAQIEADIKALRERQYAIPVVEKTFVKEVTEYVCPPSLIAKEREEAEDVPLVAEPAPARQVDPLVSF